MFAVAAFEETAQRIHKDLEGKGVHLAFEQKPVAIEKDDCGKLVAVMENGTRFSADMIAVCIGVRPNVGIVKDSGLAISRGILVDDKMRTNFEGVYAAGDCCEGLELQSGVHKHVGVWANAVNQGKVAGANMVGKDMRFGGNIDHSEYREISEWIRSI